MDHAKSGVPVSKSGATDLSENSGISEVWPRPGLAILGVETSQGVPNETGHQPHARLTALTGLPCGSPAVQG